MKMGVAQHGGTCLSIATVASLARIRLGRDTSV